MKRVKNRPTFWMILVELALVGLWILFPKFWFIFAFFIAFFIWAAWATPNQIVLEDEGDGNTYVYFDNEHSKEPGHCLILNKDNIISWDCGDTQDGTMVLRYHDEKGEEYMSLVSLVNITSGKMYLSKHFPKHNIEYIEQEKIFNAINNNREGAPGYVKPDILPVWIYKKIKAWLDPVQRAEMKERRKKSKELWDKKVEEARIKQEARRKEEEKRREEDRLRREKEKAQAAKNDPQPKEEEASGSKKNKKKKK